MASRELQRLNPSAIADDIMPRSFGGGADDNSSAEARFVIDVLRKRWWVIGICAILSAILSYVAAQEFGSKSYKIRASMMYSGLPVPGGPQVYQAPTLTTYRQILFSTANMQRICDQHGIQMPTTLLAKLFEPSISYGSSVLDLVFNWQESEEGIAILNDTMQLLIDSAAEHRRKILQEYMRHVESAKLAAKSELDSANEQLQVAKRKRDEVLGNGALTSDVYSSTLDQIASTQSAIDSLELDKLSVTQQVEVNDRKLSSTLDRLRERHIQVRQESLRERSRAYAKGSDRWNKLRDVSKELHIFARDELFDWQSYANWKLKLSEIGKDILPASFEHDDIAQYEAQLRLLAESRDSLNLQLLPIQSKLAMLRTRLDEHEERAKKLASDLTGARVGELDDYLKKVKAAEGRLGVVTQQLANLQELEQCRIREFSILMPASKETTEESSSKKKLFVLAFFMISTVLTAPVFAVEWFGQRESPVARFANRWNLPVIAERLLFNYDPHNRKAVDWRSDDAVRMTTLRIQQSLGHSGGVVLISGLGNTPTPVALLSAIAECLALREERVLLVDAIDPSMGRSRLSPATTQPGHDIAKPPLTGTQAKFEKAPSKGTEPRIDRSLGLSDYLARECDGVTDLIRPTACPGVDFISSGADSFPSEAMASSCITELFDHCRSTYSMILVAGPPAASRADFQMLAARADAILLTADRASVVDPISRAVIQDLIELRAPVIGIVA